MATYLKICTGCGIKKHSSQFFKKAASRDGLRPECKMCKAKYMVWSEMIRRCTNPKHKYYKNYGGRGITVCKEWLTYQGMEPFIEKHWEKGLQLDRIDNNKGYSPNNCRFVTSSVNNGNRRIYGGIKYRGVCFNKKNKKYMSQIIVEGKPVYLGYFTTPEEAAKAYDNYVIDNKLERKLNFGEEER